MTAKRRPSQLEKRSPGAGERTVTILGATGSIGASTVDLLKREPQRYRVEAISANSNVGALALLARELDVRFAAIGDPKAYRDVEDARDVVQQGFVVLQKPFDLAALEQGLREAQRARADADANERAAG